MAPLIEIQRVKTDGAGTHVAKMLLVRYTEGECKGCRVTIDTDHVVRTTRPARFMDIYNMHEEKECRHTV